MNSFENVTNYKVEFYFNSFYIRCRLQNLNLKTSHEFFNHKMISNQKVVNYKVSLHFKTYNFYFGGFFIRGNLKNSKFKHSFA
jgi:hypothetical protein